MKIIQPGNKPSSVVRFNCTWCGCVFEAEKDLEAVRVFDQRDGDFWQCACPTCERSCTVGA